MGRQYIIMICQGPGTYFLSFLESTHFTHRNLETLTLKFNIGSVYYQSVADRERNFRCLQVRSSGHDPLPSFSLCALGLG